MIRKYGIEYSMKICSVTDFAGRISSATGPKRPAPLPIPTKSIMQRCKMMIFSYSAPTPRPQHTRSSQPPLTGVCAVQAGTPGSVCFGYARTVVLRPRLLQNEHATSRASQSAPLRIPSFSPLLPWIFSISLT